MEAGNPTLVCMDCLVDFLWDESPSDYYCAECSAWHQWWTTVRDEGEAA